MKNKLSDGARQLGFPLSDEELRKFDVYLSELLKWNAKVNLTAITGPDEVVVKHFLDSLALLGILQGGENGPVWACEHRGNAVGRFTACDIGSGAGFPGLALKIVLPEMDIALIEPARRKAAFLRHIIRTLGLKGAAVLEARVEELLPPRRDKESLLSPAEAGPRCKSLHPRRAGETPGTHKLPLAVPAPPFNIVFSRAFKGLEDLLAATGPLLADNGYVAQSLSRSTGDRLVSQAQGLETEHEGPPPGWMVKREEEITLPFSDIRRALILLRKA